VTKRIVQAAAIYARISSDRGGEALGVARQEELCGKLAAEKGWPVARTYVDNDASAYSRKPRPDYERMLADLEAGAVDAVICVDLDRLTRRPAELESFIDLADRHGVALANVSGDTDLGTSDGRFKARILGAVARQESEKKSERSKREREQAARKGERRGGRRPFGYEPDGVTIRVDEAELVRDAARRVLAGETVRSIAMDWGKRGIIAPQTGRAWTSTSLRHVLKSARIAGLRSYRPRDANDRVISEAIFPATWPAIIDRATRERVLAKLRNGGAGKRGRPASRLLVGIATCGRCGHPLWVGRKEDRWGVHYRYSCNANPGVTSCGRLAIAADQVDKLVTEAVIGALTGNRLSRVVRSTAAARNGEDGVIADLADAENRLEDLARDFADARISRTEWIVARDRLSERVALMRKTLNRSAHSRTLSDLPTDSVALRAKWAAGSLEWQRSVIRAVLRGVTINPAPVRGRFDAERIDLDWRA
jgi:site-specific DNA recombinase